VLAEPLEAKNMEVYEAVGFKAPPAVYGCAEIYIPAGHTATITFVAKHGSFTPTTYAGSKYESLYRYCSRYEPPCPENIPSDGYDGAKAVVFDLTERKEVASEEISFNIEEPPIRYPPSEGPGPKG
jgi:hypothetical protein